jgi:hypothetical protein
MIQERPVMSPHPIERLTALAAVVGVVILAAGSPAGAAVVDSPHPPWIADGAALGDTAPPEPSVAELAGLRQEIAIELLAPPQVVALDEEALHEAPASVDVPAPRSAPDFVTLGLDDGQLAVVNNIPTPSSLGAAALLALGLLQRRRSR